MSGSSHSGGAPGSGMIDSQTDTDAQVPSHAQLLFSALTPLQQDSPVWSDDHVPPGYDGIVQANWDYPASNAENETSAQAQFGTDGNLPLQDVMYAGASAAQHHSLQASSVAPHTMQTVSDGPFEVSYFQTGPMAAQAYSPYAYYSSEPSYAELVSNGLLALEAYDPADMVDLDGFQLEDFERNLDFIRFVEQWYYRCRAPHGGYPHLPNRAAEVRNWARPAQVTRAELNGDRYDVQGINWSKIGIMRQTARRVRRELYGNYTSLNMRGFDFTDVRFLPKTANLAIFRRLDTKNVGQLVHFQLRNLLACTSKSDVYYSRKDQIFVTDPATSETRLVLDLTRSSLGSVTATGWKTSTLAAKHGVLVAGGFGGEYAMTRLVAEWGAEHVEGHVTRDTNGITNYVHTYLDRSNAHPQAVFCSNDGKLRVLDCYTNSFVKEHDYEWPVNCADASPDGRLRVLVGDTTAVIMADAASGQMLERLEGHRDFGFACAWSENGVHVATGNQDRQVRIYDARNWSRPMTVFATEMAAPRSLRFSPPGSGPPILTVAESADNVHVVDARTFDEMQALDHFGEIAGVSFTPDGSEFFVANTDPSFGGILEYERASLEDATKGAREAEASNVVGSNVMPTTPQRQAPDDDGDTPSAGRRRRCRTLSNLLW